MESSDTEVHEQTVASHAGCASRIGFSEPREELMNWCLSMLEN